MAAYSGVSWAAYWDASKAVEMDESSVDNLGRWQAADWVELLAAHSGVSWVDYWAASKAVETAEGSVGNLGNW